jgi:hypothetical protein
VHYIAQIHIFTDLCLPLSTRLDPIYQSFKTDHTFDGAVTTLTNGFAGCRFDQVDLQYYLY